MLRALSADEGKADLWGSSTTRQCPALILFRTGRGSRRSLLDRIEDNGVRIVIVEDASRFARELMAQQLGITLLINRGVRLLTASGDDLTASDDPSRKMMRQIAGAFAEYEKARLVHKLKHARDRKRKELGKCEGRKSHAELRPEVVELAKKLRRACRVSGERKSLRKISEELQAAGLPQRARQALQSEQHQSYVGGVAVRQTSFLGRVSNPSLPATPPQSTRQRPLYDRQVDIEDAISIAKARR